VGRTQSGSRRRRGSARPRPAAITIDQEDDEMATKSNRRTFLKKAPAVAAAAAVAVPVAAHAQGAAAEKPVKKVLDAKGQPPAKPGGLFNSTVLYGNLVFVAGIGAHVEPNEIKAHTKIVLDSMKAQLEAAGSSMEHVLKVNVYLNDLKDYAGMNEVFRGAFGPQPPVRTTIAAAGGIPGNSLVEIDCIACLK
jgi:enamine deaminase RidA (YjgF/YER057c/UK114 family)